MAEPLGGGGGRQRLPALEPSPVLVSACLPCRRGKVRIVCVCLDFWVWCFGAQRSYLPWLDRPARALALPAPPWEAPDPGCADGRPAADRAPTLPGFRAWEALWECWELALFAPGGRVGLKKALCSLFFGGMRKWAAEARRVIVHKPSICLVHSLVHPNPSHQFR